MSAIWRQRLAEIAPGVIVRAYRWLKHLSQREITNAAELADKVADYLPLHNEIRPYQTLEQKRPLVVPHADPHLVRG